MKESIEELWSLLEEIPPGNCASYGDLGRALANPASGLQVGRWMAVCPHGLPWWRVVSKSGALLIAKRDPNLAFEQQHLLELEGIQVVDGTVDMTRFGYIP